MNDQPLNEAHVRETLMKWFQRGMLTGHAKSMILLAKRELPPYWTDVRIQVYNLLKFLGFYNKLN